MRNVIKALCLSALLLCSPAFADTCAIDKTVTANGTTYTECPKGSTNDYLLDQGYNSARLETDVHLSETPIYAHNICRYTDARSTTDSLFVPFNTLSEWQSFVNNKPAGVDVVQCCVPRGMRTSDVPEPTLDCLDDTGAPAYWRLTGLVDPNDNSVFLAKPESTKASARLLLVNGVSENESYPITYLPIERDDLSRVIPRISNEYVARFICSFGVKPVGMSPKAAQPKQTNIGDITYVHFKLQCRDGDWRTEDCQPGQIGSLIEEPCPNGQTGKITKRLVLACPSRAITEELVSNTCTTATNGKCGPANGQSYLTAPTSGLCDAGTASAVTGTGPWNWTCAGVNGGTTASCSATVAACAREEQLPDDVQACPSGQTGQIVYSVKKIYYVDNGQCVFRIEKTLKSNTCTACDREEKLQDEVKACPAGQEGQIVYSVKKVYYSENGQCLFRIVKTLKSNTCKSTCQPEDKVVHVSCDTYGANASGPGYDYHYHRACCTQQCNDGKSHKQSSANADDSKAFTLLAGGADGHGNNCGPDGHGPWVFTGVTGYCTISNPVDGGGYYPTDGGDGGGGGGGGGGGD